MIRAEIVVPLLNANEPEARVVRIHVANGQFVEKGALLFTVETTKAASEIDAPENGYIHILAREEDLLAVGERLALLTDQAGEVTEIRPIENPVVLKSERLRITKPAQELAWTLDIDIAKLPTDRLVTEAVIRQLAGIGAGKHVILPASEKPYIVIYGGGGHAKAIMDMVKQIGIYNIAGILDDNLPAGNRVLDIPILGTRAILPELAEQGVSLAANAVGGILDIGIRVRIFELLERAGFELPALIHPRATLEPSASVEAGVQIFANAYVGSAAILHPKCMVNTNAVVSHDCQIGAYSHIAPGALLAGEVQIGERTLVGMGVTITIGVNVGSGVRIGNGANILADVPDRAIIQAGRFWVGKAE